MERLIDAVEGYQANDLFRDYKQFLQSAIHGFKDEGLEVYVLSLSEAADSLEQWRAYAPHGGVAIGFDSQKVREGFLCDITRRVGGEHVETRSGRILQMSYSVARTLTGRANWTCVRSLLERFFKDNSYPALFARRVKSSHDRSSIGLVCAIYQTICCIKHGAYAQEQEWRCVNYQGDEDDYPVRLSETSRWYIQMPFDPKDYIKEVWISPHGDKQACKRNLLFHQQRRTAVCPSEKRDSIPRMIGDRRRRTENGKRTLMG